MMSSSELTWPLFSLPKMLSLPAIIDGEFAHLRSAIKPSAFSVTHCINSLMSFYKLPDKDCDTNSHASELWRERHFQVPMDPSAVP